MQTTYSFNMDDEDQNKNYSLDVSSIIKIVSENPTLGLALVQLPINLANSIIHKYTDLQWLNNPTRPGYYWVKSFDGTCSIKEYTSKDIEYITTSGLNGIVKNLYQFAGPLEPPK